MNNKFSLSDLLKPSFWLAYLPLFFPLYLVKLDLGPVPSNVLEILVMILFVWFSVDAILKMWLEYKISDRPVWLKQLWNRQKWFLGFSALFLLIAVVSVVIVPQITLLSDGNTVFESRKVALGIFKGWIGIPYLYFAMMWWGFKKKSQLFTSLYAYLFSVLPLAIWAFYQYFSGVFLTMDGRASGPFINANYLAMYLAPAVVALWIMIVRGAVLGFKVKRFMIGMVLAILYTVALLMTHSYAAGAAVMISLLVFLLATFSIHRKFEKKEELEILKKISYFLGVFAVITVVAALVLFVGTEKWKMFTDIQDRSSSSVRLQVYKVDESLILNNAVLGLGLGQYQPRYDLEVRQILGHEPYEYVMIHPHNTLIAVWLSLGIVGLILFVGLVIMAFRKYYRAASYSEKFYRLIGLSMLLVMLLHGLVDTYLFKNDLAMMFWLIVALCFLPKKFVVEGMVVEGKKLGRTIGFPTANLKIINCNRDIQELEYGVYGGRVCFDGKNYLGAISYGLRPTVDNNTVSTFEVYIMDFEGDLYGKVIRVELSTFVRGIVKFNGLDELKAGIANDLKVIKTKVRI